MTDGREDDERPLVNDPEDFAQTKRLQQIYDARQDFQEARAEAEQLREERDWSLPQMQDHVHTALQRYFYEVEGLMRRHPKGDYYLKEYRLGVTWHTDGVLSGLGRDAKKGDVSPEDAEDEDRVFVGLESIASDYTPMPTFGYSKDQHTGEPTDRTVYVTVPEKVCTEAYRAINEFIAEVGLDADMEEEGEDAEFDYSDLLEEGPPDGDAEKPDIAADGGSGE